MSQWTHVHFIHGCKHGTSSYVIDVKLNVLFHLTVNIL